MKAKNKIIYSKLLVLILLLSFKMYSQGNEITLPNMTPPSPEAYALTKYGDIPVNEFTGMVNTTIPLYTYKAGQLELPISLNYSGAGVKVDDLSTWVGVNWTLNGSGVIARTIKDKPDELAPNRYNVDDFMTVFNNAIQTDNVNVALGLGELLAGDGQDDTEPDMFNFSFAGYSGSFFLDDNFNPVLAKKDSEIKIEILGNATTNRAKLLNSKAFCITTPDGIKYYFGGSGYTEESYMTNTGWEYNSANWTTAYYLYLIVHPIKGGIFFEYESIDSSYFIALENEQHYSLKEAEYPLNNANKICTPFTIPEGMSQLTTVKNRIYGAKFLKKITNDVTNEQVIFSTQNGSSNHFKKVLNSIDIKRNNVIKKKISFSYLFNESLSETSRFFLNKVVISNNGTTQFNGKNEVYKFEYNSPLDLPARLAFSQDYMGYYNGKHQNNTLVPKTSLPHFDEPNFADRNPVFSFASKGALTKINYPTGGYTEFDYEATPAKDYETANKILTIWRNSVTRLPISKLVEANTQGVGNLVIDENDEQTGHAGSLINQQVKVLIKIKANGQLGPTDKVYFKITDVTQSPIVIINKGYMLRDILPEDGGEYYFSKLETFDLLKNHDYHFELYSNSDQVFQTPMEATAIITYIKDYKLVNDLGVRLKSITDYGQDNMISNKKRYYYMPIKKVSQNPFEYLPFFSPSWDFKYQVSQSCCSTLLTQTSSPFPHTEYRILKTLGYSTIGKGTIKTFYPIVSISYGGDNFENGGKEKTFFYDDNSTSYFVHATATAYEPAPTLPVNRGNVNDIRNGKLIWEKDYVNRNNNLLKIQEVKHTDSVDYLSYVKGFYGRSQEIYCSPMSASTILEPYNILGYHLHSLRIEPIEIKTIEYIDPVPLNVEDESNYKKIVTTQSFMYTSLVGLPIYVSTSTSTSSEYKRVRNYYANEINSFTNLTADNQNAYTKLVSQNRVSAPVQTEVFRGFQLLSRQRTVYKASETNPNRILPEKILAAKSTQDLEERIIFSQYDSNGNPTEVSLKDGTKTRYYYNSANKVTLKIENYSAPVGGYAGEFIEGEPVNEVPVNCDLHLSYPTSLVTTYTYNSLDQLIKIMDSNCRNTYYEYDEFQHLKKIKDHDGNVLNEFNNNFRPQN